MIRRLLLLSVASFLLFSSFSNGQELSTDQSITDNLVVNKWFGGQNDCVSGVNCWAGETGGGVPNFSGSAYYWGYNGGIISQAIAINQALEAAGLQVDGFAYSWRIKNGNANLFSEQPQSQTDYMAVSVRFYDSSGNEIWGKQYRYEDFMYNWYSWAGTEMFDESIDASKIDEVILRAEGKDLGNWAGFYGPEFATAESQFRLIYSPLPDPCNEVPVVDPLCENFIGAAPQSTEQENKPLIIIASTGSIPLSEDELAVLESLEEEEEVIETPIETIETQEDEEEQLNVDALAVAKNAESNALAEAASTIDNTLTATNNALQSDLQQSEFTNKQSQQQSQQSMNEAMAAAGLEVISNDGSVSASNIINKSMSLELEIQVDTIVDESVLDAAVTEALLNLLNLERSVLQQQEELSQQDEELNEPVSNKQEDELVAAALAGSDDEDAQAALLGYNPNFRAYQQPQMADADFYKPKDIYAGQENYDNPNARLFNGASDATHRAMVRQQYEGN